MRVVWVSLFLAAGCFSLATGKMGAQTNPDAAAIDRLR